MSKFNTTIKKPKLTANKAGGQAYKQSDEMELISILLTSFVDDKFYESSNTTIVRVKDLLKKVDPLFAAKAAIFARDRFGMRSISHVIASELAQYISGEEWSKSFYDKVIVRLDDMTEILSYYIKNNTNPDKPKFPNSIKKGFASAFDRYDGYSIAKYKGEGKEVKLVDVVNLVHPTPTERNSQALKELISGELKNTETWESKLSSAGQVEGDVDDLKADVWKELLQTGKLGYFAALRNIRNIINQAPDQIDNLVGVLTNENMIKKSRVLPFRFDTAYSEISKLGTTSDIRKCLVGIDKAMNISVNNVPKLEGETLVAIDVSGSMSGKPSQIASLFGAILAKSNMCDVMTFDGSARYINYNPTDSVISIKNSFRFTGGSTNFHDIFRKANKAYQNIIILSDMAAWVGHYTPRESYLEYKKKFGCEPHIYSWDLKGYGTIQFPESRVYCLAGFSEKAFSLMDLLKTDRNILISQVNEISL